MICTSCRKEPAVLFIKVIVNNQVAERALCASCAREEQDSSQAADPFQQLLSQFGPRPRAHVSRCPACGLSFADFKTRGLFGCPDCYERFSPQLENLIPRVHGGAYRHRGKRPD